MPEALLLMLAVAGFLVLAIVNARHDDDDDGPGGPRRVRIRARDRMNERKGPR